MWTKTEMKYPTRDYYHTRCPACAANGRDTSKNNLAVYDDGHAWCFSCSHYEPPTESTKLEKIKRNLSNIDAYMQGSPVMDGKPAADDLYWPKDYVKDIPSYALTWLKEDGIRDDEIEKHQMGYSKIHDLLVMPVFDKDNNLIMWQGRSFSMTSLGNPKTPKYLTHGPKSDIMYLTGSPNCISSPIILTEDLLSSIKVGRSYQSMPIWGSTIALGMLKKLSESFSAVGIWLDPDKRVESVKMALRASQFLPAFSIFSALDPKKYTTDSIRDFIAGASQQTMAINYGEERIAGIDFELVPTSNEDNVFLGANAAVVPSSGETYEEWMNRTNRWSRPLYNRLNRLLGRTFVRKMATNELYWVDRITNQELPHLPDIDKRIEP